MADKPSRGLVIVESHDKCKTPSISERFMGVKAALITENTSLKARGDKLGLSVLQSSELTNTSSSLVDTPANLVATELLNLLGFQEDKVLDTCQFDLVFLHVGSHEEDSTSKYTDYINSLVGEIVSKAKPKSQIGSRLHLSVVLSFGDTSEDDESKFTISNKNGVIQSGFSSLL
nr:BTB/POZ domain and ankyrin repeat-containing protein [Tanacetum cinerariifolium]